MKCPQPPKRKRLTLDYYRKRQYPVLKAIKKYEKHPSIIKIKDKTNNKNISFSFSFVTKYTILNELRKLFAWKVIIRSK